ncbi:D-alanyl-D-alanine dipeptidase [Brevibacillus reuszeri]|uniref:D-alanyl-D-alanine dipeptidase n=2 Tax=Brevibacillus reuszeri TaxID=54915 RepID=A0ABQ0TWU0_9BACL|nr:M15 family metallopeptidase [Brevibacillus reuszeri]MED1859818.1 M15 family metallopeptidase [Brevibacillus reuszeri]GED72388.1 D-alanyl-D-alanine dipeptidase [Brevibacillus reuszeri]
MNWNSPIPLQAQTLNSLPSIMESHEPLLSLKQYSPEIEVYPAYYREGLSGAIDDCLLRHGVAQRLKKAAELLPAGIRLVLLDGYRPIAVQQALYDRQRNHLLEQGWTESEEMYAELHRFVARPTVDPAKPPRHFTGGAVDLTLTGPNGWLNMGTPFDDFSERAATRYYEQKSDLQPDEQLIRDHRRLLYHVMNQVGFTNYSDEWWHFDFGNQAWAILTGNERACYGGVVPQASN